LVTILRDGEMSGLGSEARCDLVATFARGSDKLRQDGPAELLSAAQKSLLETKDARKGFDKITSPFRALGPKMFLMRRDFATCKSTLSWISRKWPFREGANR
jgi:hypothetical protein